MEWIFAVMLIASLVGILLTRNMVYAVFILLATMLDLVILYVLLGADFVATTQLMIYVGGILVLMLMGIMLAPRDAHQASIPIIITRKFSAATISMLLGVFFVKEIIVFELPSKSAYQVQSTTESIGVLLFSEYLIAFETAGFLLLVALVGASSIAAKNKNN